MIIIVIIQRTSEALAKLFLKLHTNSYRYTLDFVLFCFFCVWLMGNSLFVFGFGATPNDI